MSVSPAYSPHNHFQMLTLAVRTTQPAAYAAISVSHLELTPVRSLAPSLIENIQRQRGCQDPSQVGNC